MSEQISKRTLFSKGALSAGLGLGASALLAQHASADTNFTGFAFPATGAPTPRTIPDRLADIINVKDYGAAGDGSHDDTSSIQAAFDAAFGSSASPHGTANNFLNKPVFFPAGQYKVTSTLLITGVSSGYIFGAGSGASILIYSGSVPGSPTYTPLLQANGLGFSRIEGLRFDMTGPKASNFTIAFDLNWNGSSPQGTTGNTIADCVFTNASYGIIIGRDQFQADNTTFINCFLAACDIGMKCANFNALGHTVIGGGCHGCTTYGYYVAAGSITAFVGPQFASNGLDMLFASGDSCVEGARSETPNFAQVELGQIRFDTIEHQATGAGWFVRVGNNSKVEVVNSLSTYGNFNSNFGQLYVSGCSIGNMSAFAGFQGYAVLRDCRIGDCQRNNVVAHHIIRQIRDSRGVRTFDIEGSSTTDSNVRYDGRTLFTTGVSDSSPFTVTIASPAVVTLTNHSFVADTPIAFTTTGTLPTGLSVGTTYYVKSPTTSTFNLSATAGGAAINTSGSQSGVHSLWLVRTYAVGDIILKNNVAAGGSPGWVVTTGGEAIGTAVFKALANVAA